MYIRLSTDTASATALKVDTNQSKVFIYLYKCASIILVGAP